MLTLQTLGSVELVREDGEECTAVLSQPKRCALLVYLAVARPEDFVRRDTLLALFWPEQNEAHARNALSQSLHYLRGHLPPGTILGRGRVEVRVAPGAIRVDVGDFEGAVADGRWEDALGLYEGSFLEGFHAAEAPGFEEWVAVERERLRETAATAAWSSARERIEQGALVEAERTAQRAMDLVCTDESPVRGFIQALAKAGDRAAALNFYERFSSRLRLELDLEPSPETQEMVEAIRNGNEASPVGAVGGKPEAMRAEPYRPTRPTTRGNPIEDSVQPSDRLQGQERTKSRAARPSRTRTTVAVVLVPVIGLAIWTSLRREVGPRTKPAYEYTILAEVEGSAPPDIRRVAGRLVADALAQHTTLLALPGSQIRAGLEAAMKPDTTRITPSVASELAFRAGIITVVATEVDALGDAYRVSIQVTRAENDSVLARASGAASEEDDLWVVMGELGGQLAGVLGAELGPTEDEWRRRHRPELATSSLAAYRRLLEADEANSQRRFRDAVELAHAALAIDPGYTGAWARLTGYYWNLNLRDSVLFALEQAEEKPHRVGDVAMWGARANGALAEGDLTKHLLLKERIFRDVPLGANEYAVALAVLGRHEEAVDVIEEWCADLPYRPNDTVVDNVIYWLIALGRFDDAGRWADHLSGTFQLDWQFRIALATADWAEAERHRVTLTAIYPPGIRAASLFAARGQVEEAYSILAQRSQRLAVDRPSSVLAGVEAALTLAMASGDPPPWEQALIQSDTTGRARSIAVIWAAVNRDTATARAYLSALPTPQSFETGSVTGNEAHLALAHASLAYAAEDWREVVRLLQPVTGTRAWIGAGPGPSTRRLAHWTIAAAYERLGEPDSAVVHWRKLAASEGMGGAQTIIRGFSHSFAHRRAALAYGRLDEPDKAVEHWRVFLADFSDPDPDYLWMVDEAEDELARLGG